MRFAVASFRDHGHDVFGIDFDRRFSADAYLDIGDVGAVLDAVPWRPDVIFASPPCNSFSTMTMGRMWTHEGDPKHPLAVEGRRLVLATLRIVAVLQPSFWVVENPRARLRTLDLLAGVPRVTISQCQYGTGRQKMTDLFGVLPPSLALEPPCRNGDPCHVPAPRGSRTGTQGGLSGVEAAMIPYALADAFRAALERDLLALAA